jgi:hypothetical protein
MSHETARTLDALPAPDEMTCRRLLALLAAGGAADERAA